jgi:ubiquinone/menaquinone biosynthesis C-methylase UbiE
MLTAILHRLVAQPRIYDLVQSLVGASVVRRHLEAQIALLPSTRRVLDVGGGTGLLRELLPPDCAYTCLDQDPVKLEGLKRKYPNETVLLADATQIPLESGSVDVVFCSMVSHHIPDELLESLMSESLRVLTDEGRFIFIDAFWKPSRWTGRLLWKFDRGSHPRTEKVLRAALEKHGEIVHWEQFQILHAYVLGMAVKASSKNEML